MPGFRDLDVYPNQKEILGLSKEYMRANIIKGPFRNVEDYLDIQFRLLREDFVSSLREAMTKYRFHKGTHNIDIYRNVRVHTPAFDEDSRLQLGREQNFRDLENSKKFLNGSLLLITENNFRTFSLAKVVEIDFSKKEILIDFVDERKNGRYLTVAECRCFFEPYFQVLSALQKIDGHRFPMERYIIDARRSVYSPRYMHGHNYKVPLGLNSAQREAFEAAMTREFVVIQGPPGTGKTYLGLKIAEALLENSALWHKNSPMLIISHKNHALDQFLEGLLPITKKLLRIGGQSKSKLLEKYNLTNQSLDERVASQGLSNRVNKLNLILRKALVIGMTTTTAARMKNTLEEIGSPIVIVEEAAEVLEAHVVAALSTSCQHLILLGDHLQLQPSTSDRHIGEKYHLGVSLFERMINNGIHCYKLNIQHRMRPEVAKILKLTIYPFLESHPSVYNKPPVLGVDQNVFFINHRYPEQSIYVTKKNDHEAKFVVAFATYLIQNGYKSSDMAILTTYSGQVHEIKKEARKVAKNWLSNVRISTLDSFQGQESEIIILSLVRSKSIGFLAGENRACVAMSRAKNGFYIIGNMDLFAKNSQLWSTVRKCLSQANSIGEAITLRCQKHPTGIVKAKSAQDFQAFPFGGCTMKCLGKLPCGHECPLSCHTFKHEMLQNVCGKRCLRNICDKHPSEKCKKKCGETCGGCTVLVQKEFLCGHTGWTKCSSMEACPYHPKGDSSS